MKVEEDYSKNSLNSFLNSKINVEYVCLILTTIEKIMGEKCLS